MLQGHSSLPRVPSKLFLMVCIKTSFADFFFLCYSIQNCFPFSWSCCREDKTTHFTSLFLFWHWQIYIYIIGKEIKAGWMLAKGGNGHPLKKMRKRKALSPAHFCASCGFWSLKYTWKYAASWCFLLIFSLYFKGCVCVCIFFPSSLYTGASFTAVPSGFLVHDPHVDPGAPGHHIQYPHTMPTRWELAKAPIFFLYWQ